MNYKPNQNLMSYELPKIKYILGLLFAGALFVTSVTPAFAAPCAAPNPNLGSGSTILNVASDGIYRVWSRIMTGAAASDNSYSLEIDGANCYLVGDSSAIPANTWTWVDYLNGVTTSKLDVNLTAGSHTFKMIGRESSVKIDRINITTNTSCIPTGATGACGTTPAPTVTFSASPTTITSGASATLSWSSTNATSCTASNGWTGTKATSGTQSVAPTTNTTYTLTCTGTGGSANQSATITVNPVTPPPTGTTCPLPNYPNASCTGVPAGTTLTPSGGLTLNTAGAVVSGLDINGSVIITANNVTLRNCKVRAPSNDFVAVYVTGSGAIIENCEITHDSSVRGAKGIWVDGKTGATIRRNNIYGTEDGIYMSGSGHLVEDNYIHDLKAGGSNDPHYDGIQSDSTDSTVRHNAIVRGVEELSSSMTNGPSARMTITDNLFDGGLNSLRVEIANSTGYTITNNHFGRNSFGYWDISGAVSSTVCGNVDHFTGQLIGGQSSSCGTQTTPAPTITLSASPTSITSGSSATLSWSSANATSCTASNGWTGTKATSGTQSVSPTATATYTLTCTGAGGSANQSTTVSVTTGTNPTPTVTFSASPTSITSGASANLSWSSTNATSCTASNGWTGTKATSGTQSVSPTSNTTYTLTCTGAGGSANQSTTVSVSSTPPTGGSTITIGETSVLSGDDSGNGNLLLAQSTTLSQPATIQSLSFYVKTAAGDLRLGIYDATGASGGPGALKAQTNSFTAVNGWNTQNVTAPVALPAGTYWLAYVPSSSGLHFAETGSGSYKYGNFTFGSMPGTFPTVTGQGTAHWSLYATLTTGSTFNNGSLVAGAAAAAFGIGDTVKTTANLNVRNTPNGNLLGTKSSGTAGVVKNGAMVAGGYFWWLIQYLDGTLGWSVENYLAK